MRRFMLLLLFIASFCLAAGEASAAPLLQPGKKTLYQRVVSHPEAKLYASPDEKSEVVNRGLKPFTVLYVYERGQGWLSVGVDTHQPQGWIKEDLTTAWNQSLTLLFTPRTGRDPVLFYKSVDNLKKLCSSDNMSAQIAELEGKAARGESDPRIVAAEPGNAAVSAKRFYLMPILGAPEEPFDGTKFLHVASIDPGKAGKKKDGNAAGAAGRDNGAPKTGIAIVIDTSISMNPYIQQCRNVIKTIYDSLEKEKMNDNVGFAIVAFRSSTAATPKLEYTSKVISDFTTVKNRKELETNLAALREAPVSSHDFNEDSLAGVYQAVESLSWENYDSRLIILLTDAGPLQQTDRYASVRMGPQEVGDFARQKGIWVIALHIKTPAGKNNHDYAEAAYRALSKSPDGRSNYQAINAPDPQTGSRYFAAVAKSIAGSMVQMVRSTSEGKLMTRPDGEEKKKNDTPETEAADLGARLGYAMQLDYLGRKNQSVSPEVVDSWIADMDLRQLEQKKLVPAVEVAVLVTKNQLSDLHDQLQTIIDNAERTKKTDSNDFFQGILSASTRMSRDPSMPTQGKTLAQLGVLSEFLDGLPYKSEVQHLTEEDWYRKSVGEQTAFINRLKSKIARYEEYDRDRANWESFGMSNAGDWVYRVPLSMLP